MQLIEGELQCEFRWFHPRPSAHSCASCLAQSCLSISNKQALVFDLREKITTNLKGSTTQLCQFTVLQISSLTGVPPGQHQSGAQQSCLFHRHSGRGCGSARSAGTGHCVVSCVLCHHGFTPIITFPRPCLSLTGTSHWTHQGNFSALRLEQGHLWEAIILSATKDQLPAYGTSASLLFPVWYYSLKNGFCIALSHHHLWATKLTLLGFFHVWLLCFWNMLCCFVFMGLTKSRFSVVLFT